MKLFISLMGYLCIPFLLFGQETIRIQGHVLIEGSREAAIGYNVAIPSIQRGAITNEYGYFSFSIAPKEKYNLQVSYVGTILWAQEVNLNDNTSLEIVVPNHISLNEVLVTTESISSMDDPRSVGKVSIPIEKLKKMPVMFGDSDVIKAMQLLPGVNSGNEGSSGISVRGGSLDQNLFMLDGAPIYNPSHVMGFYSVVNGEAIKSASIYKSGIPSRFGGKLSSVMDVQLREGHATKLKATAQIGALLSGISIEGPIIKNKMSFLISTRASYLDVVGNTLLKDALENDRKEVGFSDITAKLNYRINDQDKLYYSFYLSRDRSLMSYSTDNSLSSLTQDYDLINNDKVRWGNTISALRWNHIFNNNWFSNLNLSFANYTYQKDDYFTLDQSRNTIPDSLLGVKVGTEYANKIQSVNLRYILESPQYNTLKSEYGLDLSFKTYNPDANILTLDKNDNRVNKEKPLSLFAFTEQKLRISKKIQANLGLRGGYYNNENLATWLISPRINIKYKAFDTFSLFTGFELNNQTDHQLSLSRIENAADLRVSAKKGLNIQEGWQAFAGSRFFFKGLTFGLDGYYKEMNHQYALTMGATLFDLLGDTWNTSLVEGNGKAIGIEFFIEKTMGRFNGWLSYSYSRSIRNYGELTSNNYVPFKYDRPHIVKGTFAYKLSKKLDLGLNYTYQSGIVGTVAHYKYSTFFSDNLRIIGLDPAFNFSNLTVLPFSERKHHYIYNGFRVKDYSRIDLSINYKPTSYLNLSVGAYNLSSHKNIYSVEVVRKRNNDTGYSTRDRINQRTLFGILPYMNFKVQL